MSGGYQKIAADEEHSEAQIEENSKTTTEKLSVSLHDTLFEIDFFQMDSPVGLYILTILQR